MTRDGPSRIPAFFLRLLAAAAVVAAVVAAVGYGVRSVAERAAPPTERIRPGVRFEASGLAVSLGGLTLYEARGSLEEIAWRLSRTPRDSFFDHRRGGVVPGLAGRRLDVTATAAGAAAAEAGQVVGPVYYEVAPAVGLEAFPNAAVYSGHPDRSAVAIILNVAWGDEFLGGIVDLVEKAGGRLTICPVGDWLAASDARASWLAEMVSRGHEIGNHGYHNQPMTYAEAERIHREIQVTSDLIEAASGLRPEIFAPPMGAVSAAMITAAARAGCRTVMWSLDTIDWRRDGVSIIASRVTSRIGPGDIILCHPTAQTGPAMETFLPVIVDKGLRIITVSELLSPRLTDDEQPAADNPPGDS